MSEKSDTLIRAKGLVKRYGETTAVAGIDFTVQRGEVFGLLGPNGAGKTTTILMLLGLTEPDRGSARVCGLDPTRYPLAVKRQVGYLPDTVGFYDQLTARQNLRYTARLNELPEAAAEQRIDDLLGEVGLGDVADDRVGSYSRGMRQRLGVADTLVKDPLVVILDEPTIAIDPEGAEEMQRLITRLAHTDGRAILLSSHLLHQVQQICDRIAIFVEGSIVADGTPKQLGARLADGSTVYEVATPATEEQLRAALSGRTGERLDIERAGPNRWKITVGSNTAPRLVRTLVGQGVDVTEVRDLGSDLDFIYHRYFSKAEEVGV